MQPSSPLWDSGKNSRLPQTMRLKAARRIGEWSYNRKSNWVSVSARTRRVLADTDTRIRHVFLRNQLSRQPEGPLTPERLGLFLDVLCSHCLRSPPQPFAS
ncbi:protein of unknown function [Candidatus Methylomirabilis oxygeniifera]|uniref:Uncharacterized protein n=1 Tax=Methylomirabilis oxygeniifera TaxID=671143 RepID=D5MK78_METO1|nr:protein of unknown function [Candidatus Methylomirabilis oxyfera]